MFANSVELKSIFWADNNRAIKEMLLVLSATIILALSSQISIPLQPVPLTFESVTVLAIGMLLGARLGLYTVITFLITGAMGLPVFAELSGGMHVFLGPTAGYLLGFLPAVWISGYLAQKGYFKIAAIIGTVIIFSFGYLNLLLFLSPEKAWLAGVKPFMLTELVKVGLLMFIAPICWKKV